MTLTDDTRAAVGNTGGATRSEQRESRCKGPGAEERGVSEGQNGGRAGQAVGYGPLPEVREVGWAGPLRRGLEPELPGEPSQGWGTGHT